MKYGLRFSFVILYVKKFPSSPCWNSMGKGFKAVSTDKSINFRETKFRVKCIISYRIERQCKANTVHVPCSYFFQIEITISRNIIPSQSNYLFGVLP
jgi:hypothetical protein